jgi:hypothetical protein
MLEKRGLPPTLSLLAESLLDGRLPPRSIAWLKIQTIAVNIRQDYIKRWRYPEELYQFISQALKCEGARAAVNLLRGPCAARRSQQFKRGVPTFVNVNTSRSNDPSIMTHQAVRTRDKRLYDVPAHGIDPTQIGMCVTLLSRRGVRCAPPAEITDPTDDNYAVTAVLLVDAHLPDVWHAFRAQAEQLTARAAMGREAILTPPCIFH